jgi:hypothetical protein
MNAGAAAVRGPFGFLLQTTAGQYVVLGLGAVSLFPDKCNELIRPVLRSLLLGFPNVPLANEFAKKGSIGFNSTPSAQAPIVIQTGKNESTQERIVGQLITYTVTAAGVWLSYTILVNYLPDWAKEMLPVTRQVFEKAVQNLGRGILEVSEQILNVRKKQDETHDELLEARHDITTAQGSIDRCEDALGAADALQNKTQRGIRLLVRAVATMVPGSHNIAQELNYYAREIDIDPSDPAIQEINKHNPSFIFGTPSSESQFPSVDDINNGRTIKTARTPMTRSLSDGTDISEISVDGPNGKVQPQVVDNSVSYMSNMFSSTSSVMDKRGNGISMKSRIDSLLNHGTIHSN